MGFLITLIGIAAVICFLMFLCEYEPNRKDRWAKALGGVLACSLVCTIVIGVAFGIIKGISYNTYLDMMELRVTIEQEAAGVQAYTQNGVGAFVLGQAVGHEITDFKFGDYQREMSDKIRWLKDEVQDYNKHVVSKKIMKASPYWGWFIYMPDMSLEPILMGELLKDMAQEDITAPADEAAPTPQEEQEAEEEAYNYGERQS